MTARVAVADAAPQYDKLYSYLIPEGVAVQAGCRVTVPFGAGNRTRLGIVLDTGDEAYTDKLKALASLVDPEPLLNAELLGLVHWLRENTFCGYFDAVRTILPPGIGVKLEFTYELPRISKEGDLPDGKQEDGDRGLIVEYLRARRKPVREETLLQALGITAGSPALASLCMEGLVVKSQEVRRRVLDDKQVMVRLADGISELSDVTEAVLTAKQRDAVQLLSEVGEASLKEACYFAAVGKSVMDRLQKAGVIRYFTREVYRNPYSEARAGAEASDIVLSEEQGRVFETLCALADSGEAKAALLHGVTGSGKTEVFLRTIRHVLDSGRSVIVMVPEISLTPQTVARFHRYFGQQVAVLHSGLSMGERLDEWKRIRDGGAPIVIGTRSAVFAPLERIGLIVMDEEQEGSYKSEKAPRYHARDVARVRAAHHKALLLLASATPSIESYYRAVQGKYHLLKMRKRYGSARLPDVTILDMSTEPAGTGGTSLSAGLIDHLSWNLEHGEQSILLLNRRGYQTLVKCAVCGTVAKCPNCSVALTYHSANGHLMCHYCGYAARADAACPQCGSKYRRFSGVGTQKVQEELESLFPNGRILRMDMDTTMARFSHERHFNDFAAGKYDIMVGTQMVAKGLDFPNVTLVGVLSADASLYAQDYRSFERAFSLFTQVVGRSGRAGKAGRAFIQTFTPENPVIELAACQDYEGFYSEEIDSRQIHLYPPFCDMVGVGFSGRDNVQVRDSARRFLGRLVELARSEYPDLPLRVLGPCESQVARIAGKYRWRMAIKCTYHARCREFLRRSLEWFSMQKENRTVSIYIDPRYESSI